MFDKIFKFVDAIASGFYEVFFGRCQLLIRNRLPKQWFSECVQDVC